MIIQGIVIFLLKKFFKNKFLGGQELIDDLKRQLKEQQEYIDYQTKKIIELQNMVLKGRHEN